MQEPEYVVCNENTLCYRLPGDLMLGILAGKLLQGGRPWQQGTFAVGAGDVVRPATLEDFHAFRVCPRGHLSPVDEKAAAP